MERSPKPTAKHKKASCRLIQSQIQHTFIDGLSARPCFNIEDKLFSDTDKIPCPDEI